jgi:hypothetical protein
VKRNDHSATPAGAKQNVDRNNSFTYLHEATRTTAIHRTIPTTSFPCVTSLCTQALQRRGR